LAGWGRVVIGAALGAVGTLYATNEEFRKRLPDGARELPEAVRRRLAAAREAAREASETRRAEILAELEAHGGDHAGATRERPAVEAPPGPYAEPLLEPESAEGPTEVLPGMAGASGDVVAGREAEVSRVRVVQESRDERRR
jgi:hypothetical protein